MVFGLDLCLFCLDLFKSDCELIGTGGRLEAASDTLDTLYCIVDVHSGNECGNALGISRATSDKLYAFNCIAVANDVDLA